MKGKSLTVKYYISNVAEGGDSMTGFTIRPAQMRDAGQLADLSAQLGYEVTNEEMKSRLEAVLDKKDCIVYVAQDVEGNATGWIHINIYNPLFAEKQALIMGMVVDKDHRKSGIGRALMIMAEEWAKNMGCSFVRLNSSLTRKESHLFYEKTGYRNVKTQLTFMKEV